MLCHFMTIFFNILKTSVLRISPSGCRKWTALAVLTAIVVPIYGQKPVLKTEDKVSGAMAEIVTVTGDNFGSDASSLSVNFGAAKGVIQSVSNQVLEVRIPPGATYDNISVTHTGSGLTGYSRDQFLLSYNGTHPFASTTLEGQFDFNAVAGLYDLCLCDFDGDNKVDVGTSGNKSSSIGILANTSSGPGNIAFSPAATLPIGTKSLRTKCGDLDGDGKPDLVVSEDGDGHRVFVFRNTSTGPGNFSFSGQSINIGKKTTSLAIADLDLDGKPEVIISNQDANTLTILYNQSSPGTIAFATSPYTVTIPGAATTDGLSAQDLNGDGLPELIAGQYQTANSNLYVVENKSTSGTLSLSGVTTIPLPASVKNIRIGDLDGDGKPDIACTLLLSSSISILLNNNPSTGFSFKSPINFATVAIPVGLDFGDLDGDGKADITVFSINKKELTILNNESTPGSLSFLSSTVKTTYINRHVNIGDVDGDGKPDIVFTSVDDDNNGVPASKVSVFRNANCLLPEISPGGPIAVCSSAIPFRLNATASRGVTYEWRNESTNTVIASGPNPYVDVSASGKYSVTAISEAGACSQSSNVVEINVVAGSLAGIPVATNNGPLCIGSPLQLQVNDVGATEYRWTGPAGYTGTGLTPAPVNNFQLANVGRYYVDVIVGTCFAQRVSTVVEAIDVGSFAISYPGSPVICQGDSKKLTIIPDLAGTSYQWFESKDGLLAGETNQSLTVSSTGNYYVRATYPGCLPLNTDPVGIIVATPPVADFTLPSNACTGQLVQFNSTSTTDPKVFPEYAWTFGDGNTSTMESPTHSYNASGTFNVSLTVSYAGGICADASPTKPITVQSAPIPSITNPDNKYTFCQGDSIKLEVLGSYNSYLWSTGETNPSIYAKAADTYTVEVMTNACTQNASRDVSTETVPDILVTASPNTITEGETTQLNAEGLMDFQWSPVETLSDPNIQNPQASPLLTTTYTVTGMVTGGCLATGMVEVVVKGESIVTKLTPKNFFSPNDDLINSNWTVGNIIDYPQCGVSIYDIKGIKVYQAKPYLNDWDGTFKGKRLPDGVYYYIIKCDGEENIPKTGSLTLLK
jgi:gliding motility-associated-like protein